MASWLRSVVAVLAIGLVAPIGLPATQWICRQSGRALQGCICPEKDKQPPAIPSVAKLCCCDARVLPAVNDARSVDTAAGLTAMAPVVIAVALSPAPVLAAGGSRIVRWQAPRATGPPLYLSARHLLI